MLLSKSCHHLFNIYLPSSSFHHIFIIYPSSIYPPIIIIKSSSVYHLSIIYLPYIHPSIQLLACRRDEFSGATSELVTDIKGLSEMMMLF
jgi:hypothetical protein